MGAEEVSDEKPHESTDSPSCTSSQDLSWGVIVEIDTADSNPHSAQTQYQGKCSPNQAWYDRGVGVSESMSKQEEEGEVDGEEGDKLGMGWWHAIAFAEHF